MRRLVIAATLMTFALAGTALATTGRAARVGALEDLEGPHGIQQSGAPSHMPEPAAAVLFAVGIGISAWSIRRNSKRS